MVAKCIDGMASFCVMNVGHFDEDGNGSIQVEEFSRLWLHLGGPELSDEHTLSNDTALEIAQIDMPPGRDSAANTSSGASTIVEHRLVPLLQHAQESGRPLTLSQAFRACDNDGDGVLDENEVASLIDALGYDVSSDYLGGVLDIFGAKP